MYDSFSDTNKYEGGVTIADLYEAAKLRGMENYKISILEGEASHIYSQKLVADLVTLSHDKQCIILDHDENKYD